MFATKGGRMVRLHHGQEPTVVETRITARIGTHNDFAHWVTLQNNERPL